MASGTQVKRVLVQLAADDGDAEAKIDAIAAKADELAAKHPELKVKIDTAAAAAKMRVLRDELNVVAKEKPIEPEVKPKPDIPAAERAGKDAAKAADTGFRLHMSPAVGKWGSLIGAGLAALPVAAAATGALMGAALAAKLLIGTKQVQGPLYRQWQELSQGLMSVLRTSTLPLLQPLSQAFAQIGQWARQLKPLLTEAFASVGPLIGPLVKGLEGLVSGVLPGFVTLMRAGAPAVAALSGLLGTLSQAIGGLLGGMAPAVRASAGVWNSLGLLLRNLMPVVTSLSRSLAGALGPALHAVAQVVGIIAPPLSRVLGLLAQLAGSVLTTVVSALARILPPAAQLVGILLNGLEPILPVLAASFQKVASMVTGQMTAAVMQALPQVSRLISDLLTLADNVIIPLLPNLMQLTGLLVQMRQDGVLATLGPLSSLADTLVQLANKVLVPLMPLIQEATQLLVNMANAAVQAMNVVNSLLGMVGLSIGGPTAMQAIGGWSATPGGISLAPISTAGYSTGTAIGGAWSQGVYGGAANAVNRSQRPGPANLAAILASGVQAQLAGTAAQVKSATQQLVSAVTTDESAGIISRSRGSALQVWLENDSMKLQGLADRRAKILATIATAQKYAANVANTIRQQDTLGAAAAGGWNGGPQTTRQIVANLQMDVYNINKFAGNIAKLKKLGLNSAYLDQLIQMGPDAGGQLAEQLANSGLGSIKQINAAEAQIYRASGQLGKTAADSMYDTGKQAGKGFLSGLEAQQQAIEKVMQKIAATMVDTIKRELGIHSPSTVARSLTRDGWGAGLILGLEDSHSGVMTAGSRLARAVIPPRGTGSGYGQYGGGAVRVEISLTGGDAAFRTWLKKQIRITGGNAAVIGA